jgi:hypothetical protein
MPKKLDNICENRINGRFPGLSRQLSKPENEEQARESEFRAA